MRQTTLALDQYEASPDRCLFPVWSDASGRLMYPCPDALWSVHFPAWQKRRQRGETGIVEPFSAGHCMFSSPRSYGVYRYGMASPQAIRRAHRQYLVGVLHGWDTDLRQSREGMRQLARIVRASVTARLAGQNTGAFPFVACIAAGL